MTTTPQIDRKYKVIGTRPIRHDGVDKVTGKALYGSDVRLQGMLHGKVLRSPYAHAKILSIDITKALEHPDVRAVATSSDLAQVSDTLAEVGEDMFTSMKYLRDNVLASDKALYVGHAIAAIAASSAHAAEEALELIEVTYEPLPNVTDVESAMDPDAPVLHEHIKTDGLGTGQQTGTNIANHYEFVLGDVEIGFGQAEVIFEQEYNTKTVHQGYIEPQNGTAWWTADGNLTVWCSSQGHFGIRDTLSKIIGVPVSRIKVVPMEIGGGFGGKLSCYLEPLAAILSKKSGSPVAMAMSRSEVLQATGPTCGGKVRIKIGVDSKGIITAAQGSLAFEAGAYPGASLLGATACMLSPYKIENLRLDGYDVVDNKPKTSAYRAPGAPIGAFAVESAVDEICRLINMDPVEFRLLNAAKEGTVRADGVTNPRIGMIETAEAVKSHPHYTSELKGPNIGRGVAFGYWRNNTGPSSVIASVTGDGTVMLVEGSVDIGGSRTAVSQQLAEVLGIPVEDVKPQVADTDTIGITSNTGGSGVAFKTGLAAFHAANDIKTQLIERAALIWETDIVDVVYADGRLSHKSDPSLNLTFKEIASNLENTGGPVAGRSNINPKGAGGSYAANVVDVEVDPETGKITILKYTAFQDAGTAIHPSYVEGQIQGGAVQGVGWAINEEYFMNEDGRMANSSFLDYRMPTSLDIPMIDTQIIEVPNPSHPFGVRGVGESSLVPPLAAIANAVYDAIGVRMQNLPMSPGVLFDSIQRKNKI